VTIPSQRNSISSAFTQLARAKRTAIAPVAGATTSSTSALRNPITKGTPMDDNAAHVFRIYDTRTNMYWSNWKGKGTFNLPGHAIVSANRNRLCKNEFDGSPCLFKEQARYVVKEFKLVEL
jgi:hypothetical protein